MPALHVSNGRTFRRRLLIISAAIGIVQAVVLFWPEPKLIVWIDSLSYLAPSFSALSGGPFVHAGGLGIGYPGWLFLLLSINESPMTIVVAQRLMVLATYGCLAAAFVTLGGNPRVREWAGENTIATLVAAWLLVYVLYPPVSGFAHIVMPEVLFGFLLSVIAWGLIVHALPSTSNRAAGVATMIALCASMMLTIVKPHWWLSAAIMPVLLPALAPSGRRRTAAVIAGATLSVAIAVLWQTEVRLRARDDSYLSTVFGPRTLFCNSADLVRDHLARHAAGPIDVAVRDSMDLMLSPQARAAAPDWWLLGFSGDSCTHGETGRLVAASFEGRPRDEAAYYLTTYARALASRPQYLVNRLGRHAVVFASKPFNAVGGGYFLTATSDNLRANTHQPLVARWWREHPAMFDGQVALPTRPALLALRVFFVLAGIALIGSTLIAAVALAAVPADNGVRSIFIGLLICALGINVLVATVHTFEPRYLAMQTPLWASTGCAACVLLSGAIRARLLRRKDGRAA